MSGADVVSLPDRCAECGHPLTDHMAPGWACLRCECDGFVMPLALHPDDPIVRDGHEH